MVNLMKTESLNIDKWFFHYGEIKKCNDKWLSDIMYYHYTTKAGGRTGHEEYWKNNNDWTRVSVPHDWNCDLKSNPKCDPAGGYKERNVGWYYTEIDIPDEDAVTILSFDGIANQSEVYVNGILAARNFSGYTGFECDISDYVVKGEKTTIAVRVSNEQWEGWWYEGGGIYRPATVWFKNKVHLKNMETFVKPILNEDGIWKVQIQSTVCNYTQKTVDVQLIYKFTDSKENIISELKHTAEIGKDENIITVDFDAETPLLWSPENPVLYNVDITLVIGDNIVDEETVAFGFRDIKWVPDEGMYLNGKHYMINGICCHQDHGGVGVALSEDLTRYRVNKLKGMGANAYRVAHHNPSKELLKVCDELGMLVLAENRHFGTSDEIISQVEYLAKNCRNHPCVFAYSLFNEETKWQQEARGKNMARKLKAIVDKIDGTRTVTAAINHQICEKGNASEVLDIAGLNYQIDAYKSYHEIYKDKVILGTENAPTYATRGVYKQDDEKQVFNSCGDVHPSFSQSLIETMDARDASPWVAGVFLWSGFDYRGEPTPYEWPSVLSHWGFADICGFEKDTYYLVKAYYSNKPFVHVSSHWNHKKGDTVRVMVFTNCSEVALSVNGIKTERKQVCQHRTEFFVPFEEGVLIAEGYIGETVVRDCVKTAGAPAKLCYELIDGTIDKIINVWIEDNNGVIIPEADNTISLLLSGAELLGSANGNPNADMDGRNSSVPLFSGKCQFIVRAGGKATAELLSSGFKNQKILL